MPNASRNGSAVPVGQMVLHARYGGNSPLPAVRSYITSGLRRSVLEPGHVDEFYPQRYSPTAGVIGNLKFALRYEPCDFGTLHAVFTGMDREELEALGSRGAHERL